MQTIRVKPSDLAVIEKAAGKPLADLVRKLGAPGMQTSLEKQFGVDVVLVGDEPVPPVIEIGGGASGQTLAERLARPFVLMDGPAYYWQDLTDAETVAWLRAIRDEGLDGVDLELCGESAVVEYQTRKPQRVDVGPIMERSLNRLGYWQGAGEALGLIVSAKVCQSNWSAPATRPASYWRGIGLAVAKIAGPNLLANALNETDTRTPESYRSAIEQGLTDGGFPKARMIGWLKAGGRGFTERHPTSISDFSRGGRDLLQIGDHGTTIGQIYGPKWVEGGDTLNEANLVTFTTNLHASGSSGGVYSFRRRPDLKALQVVGRTLRKLRGQASGGAVVSADSVPVARVVASSNERAALEWPITVALTGVRFDGKNLVHTFSPRQPWADQGDAKHVNCNWHLFVEQPDGTFKGGTYEFGVTSDPARDKRDFGPTRQAAFGVRSGSRCLVMQSALCRAGKRTESRERSNLLEFRFP